MALQDGRDRDFLLLSGRMADIQGQGAIWRVD
jgi:hypothetical protein